MKTVILCGGSGTRLWPVSRTTTPKQFAQIFNHQSLFEKTIDRNKNLSESFMIVVNQKQLAACQSQINPETDVQFLIEPMGRNTAPAIALAAFCSKPEDILLILPSDHLIKDQDVYDSCIDKAVQMAQKNMLVTFGIEAKYPETGYGYIEADGSKVKSFKEKPDLETAIKYIASENYFWNSGMFCFKASTFLSELKTHCPEVYSAAQNTFLNKVDNGNVHNFNSEDMQLIPAVSVDYAIMEKSSNVAVVASSFYWTDLGSFDSLDEVLPKDTSGNTMNSKHISMNSKNNLIIGDQRIIATFDIQDLIIVDTHDAILIGKKGESQKVKELLSKVKEKDSKLLN